MLKLTSFSISASIPLKLTKTLKGGNTAYYSPLDDDASIILARGKVAFQRPFFEEFWRYQECLALCTCKCLLPFELLAVDETTFLFHDSSQNQLNNSKGKNVLTIHVFVDYDN